MDKDVNTEKENKKKEEKKEEKKEKKGKSKKALVITIISILSVLVLLLGGIVIWFVYRSSLENKTTGSEWSDAYYKFLKEQSNKNNNNPYFINKSEVSFAQSKNSNDPMMIVEHKDKCGEEDCKSVNVYGIVDDKVEFISGRSGTKTAETKLYYDINKQEYKYYIHIEGDSNDEYISLDTVKYDYDNYNITKAMKEKGITDFESQEYKDLSNEIFTKQNQDTNREYISIYGDERKVVQNKLDGSTIEYNAIDEKLVDTDVEPDSFTFQKGMDIIKIREGVVEEKKDYKDINDLVNKAIEKVVKKQLEIIEKTKKDIEDAKNEIKADEDRKAKEAEEALYAKGLTVGSYNLRYGTYATSIPHGAVDGTDLYGTITLKPNGKFHIKTNFDQSSFELKNIDEDGTYTVGKEVNSFETQDAIIFRTNSGYKFSFFVTNNSYFNSQSSIYNYSG